MAKYIKHDVTGLLGVTPIARMTDADVWSMFLTPQVRALLGNVVGAPESRVMETVTGFFPGDEVTNLNGHKLNGDSVGFVRFPYINTMYRTEYGALIIKRDGLKVKALGWFGDVDKGRAELIYKASLRDRRHDGTRRTNDCSLLDFPFDDPMNKPLPKGRGVELSIYGFQPGSKITSVINDPGYESFVANPFTFLDRPDEFLKYFNIAWRASRQPGQIAAPIPDVSRFIGQQFEKAAAKYGYDFIENAPSHYHVTMWALALGYTITYQSDDQAVRALAAGIKRLKDGGMKLTRPQESWVAVVQSLRPVELIPMNLYLGTLEDGVPKGPIWPQNNIDQKNLWTYKPLSKKAAEMLRGPLPG